MISDHDILDTLTEMFEEIVTRGRADAGVGGNDLVSISIEHPSLNTPILIPVQPVEQLEIPDILQKINDVSESANDVDITADEDLVVRTAFLKSPRGGGGPGAIGHNRALKKFLLSPDVPDNLCLAACCVLGREEMRELIGMPSEFEKKHLGHKRSMSKSWIEDEARLLQRRTDIPVGRECGLADIPKFEEVLHMNIYVFYASAGNRRIYGGAGRYPTTFLLRLTEEGGSGHFEYVRKEFHKSVLGGSYFCLECDSKYSNRQRHACKVVCGLCGFKGCTPDETVQRCTDCNQTFRSKVCFDRHRESRGRARSYCSMRWMCLECSRVMDSKNKERHECWEWECLNCKRWISDGEEHLCHMRAKEERGEKDRRIIYFDCETALDEDGRHVPNFILAQSTCRKCEDSPYDPQDKCSLCGTRCKRCPKGGNCPDDCGKREVHFKGPDASKAFCKWLFRVNHSGVTVIAHNGRSFDHYFLYDYLIKNAYEPECVFAGSKIMMMKVGKGLNIRCLDSLSFLSMPLSAFVPSFGLRTGDKGFYPYCFNTLEKSSNGYEGQFPGEEYFDVGSMRGGKVEEFKTWHRQQVLDGVRWNWDVETEKYTRQDVTILREGFNAFRKLIRQVSDGVDPIDYVTIASLSHGIFRTNFLSERWKVTNPDQEGAYWPAEYRKGSFRVFKEGEWRSLEEVGENLPKEFVDSPIGTVPAGGYGSTGGQFSKEALQWMGVRQEELRKRHPGLTIRTALAGGEKTVRVGGKAYRVDGYYELDGVGHCLEYNSCLFHGCNTCYKDVLKTAKCPFSGRTLEELSRLTRLKLEDLRREYRVEVKWSHEFREDMKDEEVRRLVESMDLSDPIRIRDSFFGGRTNSTSLYSRAKEGYIMSYCDVTSLYPFINKTAKYPVGHPRQVFQDFEGPSLAPCRGCDNIHCEGKGHFKLPYFGFAKVTMKPPERLFHPVLPVRVGSKLKFPLCAWCAENEPEEECTCEDSRRNLVGTWTTMEIETALDEGYELVEIHHVLDYPESAQYDPTARSGGLFDGFVNEFFTIKQQASGWPSGVSTPEEKRAFLDDQYVKEGITLDPDRVEVNKGLRTVSKQILNAFWGKFGENFERQRQNKLIFQAEDLYRLLTSQTYDLLHFHVVSQDVLHVEYAYKPEFRPSKPSTSIAIASMTSAHARLHLYRQIQNIEGSRDGARPSGEPRVLYYDTDSIIYSYKLGSEEYRPAISPYLGGMTDELQCKEIGCSRPDCEGHYIVELVSPGPKNYAYKLNTGQRFVKIRGFTLNHRNAGVLCYEAILNKVVKWVGGDQGEPIQAHNNKICRDKYRAVVYNREESKKYSLLYDKRRVVANCQTVPWGYR